MVLIFSNLVLRLRNTFRRTSPPPVSQSQGLIRDIRRTLLRSPFLLLSAWCFVLCALCFTCLNVFLVYIQGKTVCCLPRRKIPNSNLICENNRTSRIQFLPSGSRSTAPYCFHFPKLLGSCDGGRGDCYRRHGADYGRLALAYVWYVFFFWSQIHGWYER